MDAVLSVAVAATVVANPVTGVAELDATTGTLSAVNPALAGVDAVPHNLNPPPRKKLLVVFVIGVAPRESPELGLPVTLSLVSVNPDEAEEAPVVAPPVVNSGVGFTVAGAVGLAAPNVKPSNDADPELNPPTVG